MADHALAPLAALVLFGPDAIEGDPVGKWKILKRGSRLAIGAFIDIEELRSAMRISGLLPGEPDALLINAYTQDAVAALRENLQEWQREWLTRTLQAQVLISRMTITGDFLRWLEAEGRVLHRWLCVPAVQARIGQIRNSGTHQQRRRLATLLAGRSDGRPIRLPPDSAIYHAVKRAEAALPPLADYIATARNRQAAWRSLEEQLPAVAAMLKGYGLDQRWFLDPPSLKHRTARTNQVAVRVMAEELVAARFGSTQPTIRKLACRVRERRRVK